ncbi:MAG TPA: hypothetical protein VK590_09185 [Saprospiraceae bacterium]|nr:hypothetical protein [Saprospiraceae bacterium]
MDNRPRKPNKGLDKSPYKRREEGVDAKGFKSVEKSVKPVAEDTNKTRRKMVKPTATGVKTKKPGSPVYRKGKHGD